MFFAQMNQVMAAGVDYNLTLSKNENGMTVLVMPRMKDLKDDAQHHLPPLTLSGTPEELDIHFLAAITQPVQRASGLLSSMAQFERQADKAAAESKAAKDQKDKESKEVREKREKYEKFIKKSEELEESGNYIAAIDNLRQARLHATEQSAKSVDEKIAALRAKMNSGTLFEAPAPEPTSQVHPQPQFQPQPQIQQQTQFGVPIPPQSDPQQQFNAPSPAQPYQQPHTAEPSRQPAYSDPFEHIPASGASSVAHYPEQTAVRQTYMREHQAAFEMSADRTICRQDEYSDYPDFPRELGGQQMYNTQIL